MYVKVIRNLPPCATKDVTQNVGHLARAPRAANTKWTEMWASSKFRCRASEGLTFPDGSIAWTPTRRVPTLQVHVAIHNLPLDVDSKCIHVEFLQVFARAVRQETPGRNNLFPHREFVEGTFCSHFGALIRESAKVPVVQHDFRQSFPQPFPQSFLKESDLSQSGFCELDSVYNATGGFSVCIYVCMYVCTYVCNVCM